MNALGYEYTYTGSSSVPETPDNYANQMLANDVANLLLGVGTKVHGGDAASYPPADFSAANAYDGFVAAAVAAGFTIAE